MKHIRQIFTLFALMIVGVTVNAQSRNILQIPDMTAECNSSYIEIPVIIENTDEIVAMQFDIQAPSGIRFSNSMRLTDRSVNHSISARNLNDSTLRVMVYSPDNKPFRGNAGVIANLKMNFPESFDGKTVQLRVSDAVLSDASGDNVLTELKVGTLLGAKSPDLEVSGVTFSPSEITPGEELTVNWKVRNIGSIDTRGGWSERIILVQDNTTSVIGTVYHEGTLASGVTEERTAILSTQGVVGISGAAQVRVQLLPNNDCGEPGTHRGNNIATSDATVDVVKKLEVMTAPLRLNEYSNNRVNVQVKRTGNYTAAETFTITKVSGDDRLSVPETLVFKAGNPSAFFTVAVVNDDILNDDDNYLLRIEGNGYLPVEYAVTVIDDELPAIDAASSLQEVVEGDEFTIAISLERAPAEDLTVNIYCNQSNRFTFPSSVVIPAGESAATITVKTVENDVVESDLFPTFSFVAAGYRRGEEPVILKDNDLPEIALTMTPTTVNESAGPRAIVAKLTRLTKKDNRVVIKLSDTSAGRLSYQNRITLDKGIEEVEFNIGVIDNAIVDGDEDVTITAAVFISSCNCTATGETVGSVDNVIRIIDNDGPAITVNASKATWLEGAEGEMLTISRNTPTDEALTVNISSDHDAMLEYEHTVTIPAGKSSVQVPVTVKRNDITGDSDTYVFTVEADGHSQGNCWVMISDQTLPDAVADSVVFAAEEAEVAEDVVAAVTIKNDGVAPIPAQTKVNFYISGNNAVAATAYTQSACAPGESVTASKAVTLPNVPGEYKVTARVNEDRRFAELTYVNNSVESGVITVLPGFTASISADKQVYSPSEVVILTGRVRGNKAANSNVEVYLICEGARQTINAVADENGNFTAVWTPYARQSGHFIVGACYPGENLRASMAEFDVYGIERTDNDYIKCEATYGEPYTDSFSVRNTGVLGLTGVTASVLSKPDNCTVEVEAPTTLSDNEPGEIRFTITPGAPSTGNSWETILIGVNSAEGASYTANLYYYCYNRLGKLKASVGSINTTMTKDVEREYSFRLTNVGKGSTGAISLSLPSWIKTATPSKMASINPGDTATVVLRLMPTEDMQLNVPRTGGIGINCETGEGLSLPFNIEPVSETTGLLVIDVCDENTYYGQGAPHLEGAKVKVTHPTRGTLIAEGVTGNDGHFSVDLPEGYYTVNVTAENHDSFRGNLLVDPGKETVAVVNLSINAITVDWTVEETEVEDEYKIVTTVTYETNVPVPVVEFTLPYKLGVDALAEGESIIFNGTVTNKGLITAKSVQFKLPPSTDEIMFSQLAYLEDLEIAPQQTVIVPFKVTRLPKTDPDVSIPTADKARKISCSEEVVIIYMWDCGLDRKYHQYPVPVELMICDFGDVEVPKPKPHDWGGPGGPGGNVGDFGGYYDDRHISTGKWEGCEPCQNRFLWKMLNCTTHIPGLDKCWKAASFFFKPKGTVMSVLKDKAEDILADAFPPYGLYKKIKDAKEIYDDCIKPLFEKCEPGDFKVPELSPDNFDAEIERVGNGENSDFTPLDASGSVIGNVTPFEEPSYILEYREKLRVACDGALAIYDSKINYFGSDKWLDADPEELYAFMKKFVSYMNEEATIEELRICKPQNISAEDLDMFVERIYNTMNDVDSDNKFDIVLEDELYGKMAASIAYAKDLGYSDVSEMMSVAYQDVMTKLTDQSKSVCATVSIEIDQTMVLTRQAFRGTLTVNNGAEEKPMKEVRLNLEVVDEDGNIATSHEFEMTPEPLSGFTGSNILAADCTLDAKATGVAKILFIPTRYAAPEYDKVYHFGGSLSYIDPFTDTRVVRDLTPVSLTVKPSPILDMTYFMQRDVYGDDPETEDVEPMVPAEFSVLINNTGYGEARNVKMTTEQPRIVDNEKGLAIDFSIISSQLNGGDATLALGERVTTDFGNIASKATSYAQWWLTASLLGHFIDYQIEATHVTSYGNPDLSLLGDVTIHELVRSLDLGTDADGRIVKGFLVNDVTDAEDTPDNLYISDGSVETVSAASSSTIVKSGDNEYTLTVGSELEGWTYGNLVDPTAGRREIESIVRVSDGAAIATRNIWQTACTLRDGRDPMYENLLHFAVEIGSGKSESYRIAFARAADVTLAIDEIVGAPEEDVITSALTSVNVRFNKEINDETFTTDDIAITRQGVAMDASQIEIAKVGDTEYALDMSRLTTTNGYYVLTVNTKGITDLEGFSGVNGTRIGWSQIVGGKVSLTLKVTPEGTGHIDTEEGEYEHTSVVPLNAVPAEGWQFARWIRDGETVSTKQNYNVVLESDVEYTAEFTRRMLNVNVTVENESCTVEGSGNGTVEYGSTVNFSVNPSEGWHFEGWMVNGEIYSTDKSISLELTDNVDVLPVMTDMHGEMSYVLKKGWNWITPMFGDSRMSDPWNFISPFLKDVKEFSDGVNVIKNDPKLGITGNLAKLQPQNQYKINVARDIVINMQGAFVHAADQPIEIAPGWNRLGYFLTESLALDEALAGLESDYNDVIKGHDSFAVRTEDGWVGTLEKLVPGMSYEFGFGVMAGSYNPAPTTGVSFNYPVLSLGMSTVCADNSEAYSSAPEYVWTVDGGAYPDNISVIATLSNEGYTDADLTLGAFVGDECRGVATEINGRHFLVVHKDSYDTEITFRAIDRSNGTEYMVDGEIAASEAHVGAYNEPLALKVKESSGVIAVDADAKFNIFPNPVRETLNIRGNTSMITGLKIVSLAGSLLLDNVGDDIATAIDVASLPNGVYLLFIETAGNTEVHRFIKN